MREPHIYLERVRRALQDFAITPVAEKEERLEALEDAELACERLTAAIRERMGIERGRLL